MNGPLRWVAVVALFGLIGPDGGEHGGSASWVYEIQPVARVVAALAIAGLLGRMAWGWLRPRERWRDEYDFEPPAPRPHRNRRTHRLARFLSASPTLRRL